MLQPLRLAPRRGVPFKGTGKQPLRADGALVDSLTLVHGLWEAKDSADNLEKEIKSKVAHGYPLTNILFQSPDRAVLYQDNRIALDCSLDKPENLVEILQLFFDHRQPHEVDWEEAVFKFAEKIPDLAEGVTGILNDEYAKNKEFQERFKAFAELCRQSINPSLTNEAIQKMLVQHLLTERVFRKVFNNNEFLQRNVIAAEIEKVIQSITAKHFSRDTFLKPLDRFYTAIEKAAESQTGYTEKQHFLNAVYEKFFQSFDKKQADTHGIVYTPQPIVDFMVRSVEEILKTEFGKSLSDEGVHILDPFTGTGNFITRIMQSIKKSRLPQKYANELHCNEVMLLPYYIASMNIEHAYSELVDIYAPFDGICLVDTFETLGQMSFFSSENTERVRKQAAAPIRVVIGNPPYNMNQDSEDERNKNRKYLKKGQVDQRIADTYMKSSRAQLKNKLGDPYIKALRWATDRIQDHGIVCLVTNNKFISGISTDGVRRHLAMDFDVILHLNSKGNANTAGIRRRREGGNIFDDQIKVGVGISLFIKNPKRRKKQILMHHFDDYLSTGEKTALIKSYKSFGSTPLTQILPDDDANWEEVPHVEEYQALLPLSGENGVFLSNYPGINTARDHYLYNWRSSPLEQANHNMTRAYKEALVVFRVERPENVESITSTDDIRIKWGPRLWGRLSAEAPPPGSMPIPQRLMYRPFTAFLCNSERFWIERPGMLASSYNFGEANNTTISFSGNGVTTGFFALATNAAVDFHFTADSKTVSFYEVTSNGTKQDNISSSCLAKYRKLYSDKKITKWDIFHSTYALLHHPEYRTRYAANLKRELPRIPFPPDLHAFAAAGKRLMELHIDYEQQPEHPLEEIELPNVPWTLRVERMRLSKDKTEIRYNQALTLRGIPPAAFDYRLGNRSALEWVIDQYQVSTDKRSGITNDPNRTATPDDPNAERYILRLIGQVITVSLETQQIIAALPSLNLENPG